MDYENELFRWNIKLPNNLSLKLPIEGNYLDLHCTCGYPDSYQTKWFIEHGMTSYRTKCPVCRNTGFNMLEDMIKNQNITVEAVDDNVALLVHHVCGESWDLKLTSMRRSKKIKCPKCPEDDTGRDTMKALCSKGHINYNLTVGEYNIIDRSIEESEDEEIDSWCRTCSNELYITDDFLFDEALKRNLKYIQNVYRGLEEKVGFRCQHKSGRAHLIRICPIDLINDNYNCSKCLEIDKELLIGKSSSEKNFHEIVETQNRSFCPLRYIFGFYRNSDLSLILRYLKIQDDYQNTKGFVKKRKIIEEAFEKLINKKKGPKCPKCNITAAYCRLFVVENREKLYDRSSTNLLDDHYVVCRECCHEMSEDIGRGRHWLIEYVVPE